MMSRDPLRLSERVFARCPKCGMDSLTNDPARGELFCRDCGFVVREKIEDLGPERPTIFSTEDSSERVGKPISIAIHDMGLTTVIGKTHRDASGRFIPNPIGISRLRKWDSRSPIGPRDENLKRAFRELDRLSSSLAVSETVTEKAAYIYRKALLRGLVRGRSIRSTVAASFYASCRSLETPRSLKDVARVSNMSEKELSRSYRILLCKMEIKMPVPDATRNVSRIADTVGLSERTKRKALEIIRMARDDGVSAGKDPDGLAGSAIYAASILENEHVSQKNVARAARVTEVTIRSRHKTLLPIIQRLKH